MTWTECRPRRGKRMMSDALIDTGLWLTRYVTIPLLVALIGWTVLVALVKSRRR